MSNSKHFRLVALALTVALIGVASMSGQAKAGHMLCSAFSDGISGGDGFGGQFSLGSALFCSGGGTDSTRPGLF